MKITTLASQLVLSGAVLFLVNACSSRAESGATGTTNAKTVESSEAFQPGSAWNAYWYQGLAEVSSYTLQQGRYTEVHRGSAVNIFVTEDFSKEKQVKLDNAEAAGSDRLPILKLNQSIKFNTGVYPYSVMNSVFLPIDQNNYPHAEKISCSVQDWCGMAYMQMNRQDDGFGLQQYSYFESEGDREFTFNNTFFEDELWPMIRLRPSSLPTGKMNIVPSLTYLRFSHKDIRAYEATVRVEAANGVQLLSLEYPALNRTLKISFSETFPYQIQGWEETYAGFNGQPLTTKATLDKVIMLDYWTKHNNADRKLRKDLGLPENF
jgi:hypothetical protein